MVCPFNIVVCLERVKGTYEVKILETGMGSDFINYTIKIHPPFMVYCYMKRCQAENYIKERERADSLIRHDFPENYTCVAQDEIQSAHWAQSQVSLFTISMWY